MTKIMKLSAAYMVQGANATLTSDSQSIKRCTIIWALFDATLAVQAGLWQLPAQQDGDGCCAFLQVEEFGFETG